MKYFVTGATGFVGGRVVRQLRAAGHEVNALVRNPDKAQDLKDLGIAVSKGDVTLKESLYEPMRGCDGVFHIAGWYKIGVRDKSDAVPINIEGTRNVLSVMMELNITKGVYTSTLAINSNTKGVKADEHYEYHGKHISEYDRTKAEAHKVAQEFIQKGLPLVIVMPGAIYGPGDNSLMRETLIAFLQKKLPMVPHTTAYCFAHVDDIAQAHIMAMEKGRIGETYIICGPAHTVVELVDTCHELTGIKKPMIVSPSMLKISAAITSVVEKLIPVPEIYSSEYTLVAAGNTYLGNNSKAVNEFGYQPRSIKEGLKETLEHEMKILEMKKR